MSEKEFNVSDPKYPHQHLTDEGLVRDKAKKLLKTLPKKEALLIAYGWCNKARTSEYIDSTIKAGKMHLEHPRKGSKKIRELAKIKPFYSFLMKNKALLTEALNEFCYSDDSTLRFFKSRGNGPPRSFERATITYLYYKNQKKHAKQVAGHIGASTKTYARTPDFSVESVKENLKENPELLVLFNGLLSAFNRTIERLENRIDSLENNK